MTEATGLRVLGAVRFTDAVTGTVVRSALDVSADGLRLHRNRAGLYVIMAADGLAAHRTAFLEPPAAPLAESLQFTLKVKDPDAVYTERTVVVRLPRRYDPQNGINDVMEPIDVALASAPVRSTPSSWARLWVTVESSQGAKVRGALVEARPDGGGPVLAWGTTNKNGETLLPVPGLPALLAVENDPLDPNDDTVVTAETRVGVSAVADPALPWPVNPARLSARGPGLRVSPTAVVAVSPGRTNRRTLSVNLS